MDGEKLLKMVEKRAAKEARGPGDMVALRDYFQPRCPHKESSETFDGAKRTTVARFPHLHTRH
jgi:hypothetical protein